MIRQLRYMASYAGDYSKYMNGQGSQGGAQGGDYKQQLLKQIRTVETFLWMPEIFKSCC